MKDRVLVRDYLSVGDREFGPPDERQVIVEGFFSCVCPERGKLVPGTKR